MKPITLHTNHMNDVTIISNIFIDEYMPKANGSFVKVYLYLLRLLSSADKIVSVAVIADCLEVTEKDIIRALNYWDKTGVLSLEKDRKDTIIGITLNDLALLDQTALDEIAASSDEDVTSVNESDVEIGSTLLAENDSKTATFEKPTYSPSQIEALTKSDEIKWLMNIIEIYLERLLKPTDIQLILFLYENVGFSVELIMYLYEYCVSKNKKNSSYIEAVALRWAEEGIDTVEKAEATAIAYNANFNAVSKAFGLNRMPGAIEQKYITKWIRTYAFSIDIIVEACNRTILSTKKPDFKYADKILESWSKKGVHHLSDIEKLDLEHAKNTATPKTSSMPKQPTNKFNAFPQRTYTATDYSSLEQRLLNKQ
ncbi:DnaD domain protein [Anaerosporobacter faecicola]|uniref:DnaD domain protein n=1 Tax=Anaerosporobacter faecicola TaxID=2718714 RepID=UPI00143B2055|nr:DnaD domain protein [Anaerosporobacter faecicola]